MPWRGAAAQLRAWRWANLRHAWGIGAAEFASVPPPPSLGPAERELSLETALLCYGFGPGPGAADAALSGLRAWERALARWRWETWQCRYVDLADPKRIRLRPGAPPRPRGFYWVLFRPGGDLADTPVERLLRGGLPPGLTGSGPEALQMVAVTHPHLARIMEQGRLNFMALADYEVAPYGFGDFCEAPQLFCNQGTLGLGVGNVAGVYPRFGIPLVHIVAPPPPPVVSQTTY
ncbi:MAG: hypothetical protein KQI62_21535 [Deltaproteobacteria bacterium]|nr:hypothetical protein [Deltaproteobacteria bacterium]